MQAQFDGDIRQHKSSPLIMVNNRYIGGTKEFMEWALFEFRYLDKNSEDFYKQAA